MRFADVILLLAECELNLRNIPAAINYIDQIRTRGNNLLPYSGSIEASVVKEELIRQRAIEFFKEGERFYDLRRWGLLEKEFASSRSGTLRKLPETVLLSAYSSKRNTNEPTLYSKRRLVNNSKMVANSILCMIVTILLSIL